MDTGQVRNPLSHNGSSLKNDLFENINLSLLPLPFCPWGGQRERDRETVRDKDSQRGGGWGVGGGGGCDGGGGPLHTGNALASGNGGRRKF